MESTVTGYEEDPIIRPLLDLGMAQRDRERHKGLKRASIMVLLFRFKSREYVAEDEWHVLFTQRPMNLNSHPGEVCLPGGRQDDADDGNDITTALRETMEEMGIPANEIVPFGRTETAESVNGLCVTPILGVWKKPVPPSQLTVNAAEVEATFYVPLSYFWDEQNCADKRDIDWRGDTFTMRTYLWKGDPTIVGTATTTDTTRTFKIWGLTAHVIYEVAKLCKPSIDIIKSTGPTEGYLYKWMDGSGGKPHWAQRYFVLSNARSNKSNNSPIVLHQYASKQKAKSKAETATKKNRIILDENGEEGLTLKIVPPEKEEVVNDDHAAKWAFTISVLEGRNEWKLAAETEEERDRWVVALKSSYTQRNSVDNKAASMDRSTQVSQKKPKTTDAANST